MNICKVVAPKVINTELLIKCVKQDIPKGESRRLAELEGVDLSRVDGIRLEFLNILRIDHLWVLTSLTRLSLNNNLIEKIENIDMLVNLTELDLSFNKIKKIENLNNLGKLEKLSFFDNKIEKLENMDKLKKMKILSVGNNLINNADNVLYLRRFSNLRCVNLARNPVATDPDFRLYVAALLPEVVYYEYKLISAEEREKGRTIFKAKLIETELGEAEERAAREKEEKELADAELHKKSFVEFLNTTRLWDSLWSDDEEGRLFFYFGPEVVQLNQDYGEKFNAACKQIFDIGQSQYLVREEEIEQFFKCVKDAKQANQNMNIQSMEEFLEKKSNDFYKFKKLLDNLREHPEETDAILGDVEVITKSFEESTRKLWKTLMKLEIELHEQCEEVNTTFEHTMTEMVNFFVESVQGITSGIRMMEVAYNEAVTGIADAFYNNLTAEGSTMECPEPLQEMMAEKDNLVNALAGSHDWHLQLIDGREDVLVTSARDWLHSLVSDLEKDEVRRNRMKILELNHFLDIQNEEFNELLTQVVVIQAENEEKALAKEAE